MTYFNIEPTTINTTPFDEVMVNAIRWIVASIPRGIESTICDCTLMYVDSEGEITDNIYFYNLPIPKNVLDVWLEDEVIDNYIIEQSNGLFIKA